MTASIQAVRGMNDILPSETSIWQHIEHIFRQTLNSFGYQEIRLPIIEKTELFKRSVGEATDIVEKEMYTFEDRNGDSLSLRPEGTAGCVRAGIEHGLLYNQTQRLWYMGPFFRHERPQKGRYRQFNHCGVETYGFAGPDIEAELILLSARLIQQLGLSSAVTLEINSIGTASARQAYLTALRAYLTEHTEALDEDSRRRLTTNPLRILDSKNPGVQAVLNHAPNLSDYLEETSRAHAASLQNALTQLGIPFRINPRLVRGLDYYSDTVFEWLTNDDVAQNAVCAGGRYDHLVEQLGGKPTPACGFAFGMERLILLMQSSGQALQTHVPDAYMLSVDSASHCRALQIADQLRKSHPTLCLMVHAGGGSLKNQFRRADRSGAKMAFILGEQEMQDKTITLKSLREDLPQRTLSEPAFFAEIHQLLATQPRGVLSS